MTNATQSWSLKSLTLGCLVLGFYLVNDAKAIEPETLREDLPTTVLQALNRAGIAPENVSLVVWSLGETHPRLNWNGNTPRNPASLIKLVTTTAALEEWGPAHTWTTNIRAENPPSDRLRGNLGVEGSGDPGLTLAQWQGLWRQLYQQGTHHIEGTLIFNQQDENQAVTHPDDFDHEGFRAYNTLPARLQVGQQAQWWYFQPGIHAGDPIQVWPEFPFPAITLKNHLLTTLGPCPRPWRAMIHYAVRAPQNSAASTANYPNRSLDKGVTLELNGVMPQSCGPQIWGFSLLTNQAYLTSSFQTLWHELGGSFSGHFEKGNVPTTWPVIASVQSRPLLEILMEMNKNSNNLIARTLLLDLGQTRLGDLAAENSSTAQGIDQVRYILGKCGLDFPEMVLDNGAGLSRQTRINALHLAQLLRWMQEKSWYGAEFIATLPLSGVDGTMRQQYSSPDLQARFHLKSGTLNEVKGIAGYGRDAENRPVTLVFMVNGTHANAAEPAFEALLQWIAQNESKIPQ
ncbi:MAG: D-alanyl-D-alanine carboxypeptidase/D-alanyl-D-alanine-endopeptidase [Ferrovum sp.]|nr:D-alanyl-D-alanine carboxypeptidase/D-alanyl-D-alanine-endopeptidase [Ferrovum sp.]NDU87416.1 D-alanyl-D-alanine carboxypeptidase/D-alanyl-D-alanine-endopeptidase [Ferrovum sp.]